MIHPDENELEPLILDRDSTPRPRLNEKPIQLERRISDMETELHGKAKSHITNEQVDDIVLRISTAVTAAVMEAVAKDTKKAVQQHISEAMKTMAFRVNLD